MDLSRLLGDVGWKRGARFLLVILAAGALVVGERSPVEARQYSDPEEPVVSVVLSDERNVEDLQKQADLTDGQVEEILALVRE